MPPIVSQEERASFIQASPVEKRLPRGFVAAVPTSPAPSTTRGPPTLQPPPPSHYLRNRSRSSEDSDLFIKRSEIYTRVQRVLPSASHAEDSASGLLFGSDFHTTWTNTRLGRPRGVVASPIHVAHIPAAPRSAEPPSVMTQLNSFSFSNEHSMLSPRARDEDDALEVSPFVNASSGAPPKERACRRPFRTLFRERLTVKVASRSVEAVCTAQPSSSTDDLPRHHLTELYPPFSQQYAIASPPSPGSSASSAASEPSCWSSETDIDKKSVPQLVPLLAWQKENPPTPPSPSLHTPPSASISLLEAQKVRRAKACDKFTRYSETTPFQSQRGSPNNTVQATPVPVQVPALTLHSAYEIPTEAPVQMEPWTCAIELHRVSSAPNLQHHSHSQPQPQPQPRPQPQPQLQPQPQPHLHLHPQRRSQSQSQLHSLSQLVASQYSQYSPPPPHTPPPLLALHPSSHVTPTRTPAITTTAPFPAPRRKLHRASPSASRHHNHNHNRQSTGALIPSVSVGVGSLKAILRPRSHSKPVLAGVH